MPASLWSGQYCELVIQLSHGHTYPDMLAKRMCVLARLVKDSRPDENTTLRAWIRDRGLESRVCPVHYYDFVTTQAPQV